MFQWFFSLYITLHISNDVSISKIPQPLQCQCKVGFCCDLGSAHSGPRDACLTANNTRLPLAASPLHATPPPPRLPPPSPLIRCLVPVATQVPSPPDLEPLPMSHASPAVAGRHHKSVPPRQLSASAMHVELDMSSISPYSSSAHCWIPILLVSDSFAYLFVRSLISLSS